MKQTQVHPPLLLGGLADEAANQKTAMQQFCAFAAMGLRYYTCLLYTSPSPRDVEESRMPSSA